MSPTSIAPLKSLQTVDSVDIPGMDDDFSFVGKVCRMTGEAMEEGCESCQ